MKWFFLALVIILNFNCAYLYKETRLNKKSAGIAKMSMYKDTAKIDEEYKTLPTVYWSHYDATQRSGLYLVQPDGRVKILSENPPDAAVTTAITALASAQYKDSLRAEAAFTAIKSVAELGSRNATNYLVRDLAFRIESLKLNEDTIDTATIKLYMKLMEAAENMVKSESVSLAAQSKSSRLESIVKLVELAARENSSAPKIDSTLLDQILRTDSIVKINCCKDNQRPNL